MHTRRALKAPPKGVAYSLLAGDSVLGLLGDVKTITTSARASDQLDFVEYPFSIIYNELPLSSAKKLVTQGPGIPVFILLMSSTAAHTIDKYLNKNDTPGEAPCKAMVKGEIVSLYQPVVDGRGGTLRGAEVLARWKYSKTRYISPISLIPVTEKSDPIVLLAQSLMRQVAANMNVIVSKLPSGLHIDINFSAPHITSPIFAQEYLHYRDSFGRDDLNLVIEVTEREPLDVDGDLVQRLNILYENGFVIALGDFSTGYPGLSCLHDMYIDYIKIDQSFVGRVNELPDSTWILDCVLDLTRKLSLSIVAGGAGMRAQLGYFDRNNIVFLQGYYFYKPVTSAEFVMILLPKPKVKVPVE